MTLLAAPRLHKLIDENVINALHENVNSASIDIRIGNKILIEGAPGYNKNKPGDFKYGEPVDIAAKQSPQFTEIEIPEEGIVIEPGECFLAHSIETFNLPNTISSQFILRSSVARCFLEHMQAGWADAGWHGAQLTMEFCNMNRFHRLLIKPGMRIGQMVFFEHEDVGADSYAIRGNYNNQQGATQAFTGEGHVG